MEKKCSKCGGETFHNTGISKKNNKPYENYKCKDQQNCKHIEWVDLDNPRRTDEIGAYPTAPKKQGQPDWDKIRAEKEGAIREGLIAKLAHELTMNRYLKSEISMENYYEELKVAIQQYDNVLDEAFERSGA